VGIDLPQRFEISRQPIKNPWPEVVKNYIRYFDQVVESLPPSPGVKIERYTFLVSVDSELVEALSSKFGSSISRYVTYSWRLNLDDLSS